MNNTPFYYYTLLDIPNDAPLSEVKKAYRRKALKYHPDKCRDPRAAETFKEINQAFHILSDIDKRRSYDNFGGVERVEMPITLTKPFEDFCEGIALGSFSVLSNLAFMAIFGVPGAIGAGGWLVATQMFTAWQFVPSTMEEAKEMRNWSRSFGAVISPLFLLTSTSFAAGYFLLQGGKLAIEYTRTTMESIGESLKKSLEMLQSRKTIAMDDWVFLDEGTSKKKKKTTNDKFINKEEHVDEISPVMKSSDGFSSDYFAPSKEEPKEEKKNPMEDDFCALENTSQNLSSDSDWVLLDDML